MKITGQLLKEQREKKGISINEVAIATKINNKTLMAMEAGDLGSLPPKTFLRGFVRAYASYLELDVEGVLNTFFDEMGTTNPKQPTPPPQAETPVERPASKRSAPGEANDAINPKTSMGVKIGAGVGILLLVLLIAFFKNKMESYEKEAVVDGVPSNLTAVDGNATGGDPNAGATPVPDVSPTPPGEPPASSPTPADNSAAAAASASPTASPTATATPAPSATPSPSPSPSATPKPTATPTPTPTPKPSPSPTATPTPAPSPSPTPAPSPSPSASPKPSPTPGPGKPQEVIIEALNDVEIDMTIDGETKKVKMSADQVQTIKAKRKVVLKFSNGGAVNLIVNGTERGVPGDLGKPHKLELP